MTGQRVATQEVHPWRATLRTAFAALAGLALSWGVIVEALQLPASWEWVGTSVLVAAGITRVMAVPAVNVFLGSLGLGATPAATGGPERPAKDEDDDEPDPYDIVP